ncbi:hypothetical protein [Mesorhizobium sp. L-8-10]|uniref:hypothetical protein n=1 Tax=Mesorhizobium sp. L-8-10 TaxID=2744523 RepID=UPI0019296C03|nr:hypothetical protein [Mesorhizobium sp. L-8-10]
MAFDLTKASPNSRYRLRNGAIWTFRHLGHISKLIAVGEVEAGSGAACLFADDGRYRMDGEDHMFDIVKRLPD